MNKNRPGYLIPNHVIHAVIAGVLFLLVAVVLGMLMFADGGPLDAPKEEVPREMVQKQAMDERPIVVLDAGHGGSDPGAVSGFSDDIEAEITQIITDKLAALLEQHKHELIVEQAHQAGTYATTMARANTALQLHADVLISLHVNADTNAATRGFQVYPLPPGRAYHSESLRLGQLMTQHVAAQTEMEIQGENGIFYAYYHEIDGGGYWKELVDSAWTDPENPSASPSFGVIENAGCPAVLVEQWFISNPADMALMNNENGRDAMARGLYLAICEYFGLAPMA